MYMQVSNCDARPFNIDLGEGGDHVFISTLTIFWHILEGGFLPGRPTVDVPVLGRTTVDFSFWGFPKIRDTSLGVPTIRVII